MTHTTRKLATIGMCVLTFGACTRPDQATDRPRPVLRAYTYDSFLAKEGLGAWVKPEFEKRCGCELKLMSVGDGGQIVARLELDAVRKIRGADVILGLDELGLVQAAAHLESWGEWEPKGFTELLPVVKAERGFMPMDFGFYAMMAHVPTFETKKIELPKALGDLVSPNYRKRFVLEDPRSSGPGLAFLLFTQEVLGSAADAYWGKLKQSWLAMAPSWDAAYGLFLKGEAPLVWSYTTSQAYHRSQGDTSYRAVVLDEGAPIQVEGAVMVRGIEPDSRRLAEQLFEFLLTPETQTKVFTSQWMYPVLKGLDAPQSFLGISRPSKAIHLKKSRDEVQAALARFAAKTR